MNVDLIVMSFLVFSKGCDTRLFELRGQITLYKARLRQLYQYRGPK